MRRRTARLLAAVVVIALSMAGSPRLWSSAVAIVGVSFVGGWWALLERRPIETSRIQLVVAALGAWGIVQLLMHSSIAPWLTVRATLTWAACAICFFIASQAREHRKEILSILLWGSAFLALAALVQSYAAPGGVFGIFSGEPTAFGTFLYKNYFAAMAEMAAPIALYRSLRGDRAAWAAFGALCAAVVVSASRAGVILLTVELLLAIFLSRRVSRTLTVSALIVISIAGSFIAGPERVWEHFHDTNFWSVRGRLLKSTLQMAWQRPWMGNGLGAWRTIYPYYATFDAGLTANEAHNDWAEWTAEGGIPFVLLLATVAILLVKPAVSYVWALGIPVVLLHSLIDYPSREPAVALLWFALAGLLSQCQPRETKVMNIALNNRSETVRKSAVRTS